MIVFGLAGTEDVTCEPEGAVDQGVPEHGEAALLSMALDRKS